MSSKRRRLEKMCDRLIRELEEEFPDRQIEMGLTTVGRESRWYWFAGKEGSSFRFVTSLSLKEAYAEIACQLCLEDQCG